MYRPSNIYVVAACTVIVSKPLGEKTFCAVAPLVNAVADDGQMTCMVGVTPVPAGT